MSTSTPNPNQPAPAPEDLTRTLEALRRERDEHKATKALLSTFRADVARISGLPEDSALEAVAARLGDFEKTITERLAPVLAEKEQAVARAQTLEQEKRAAVLENAVDQAIRRSGIKSECVEDAKLHLRAALEVNEKGEVVTKGEGEVGGQSPDWFVVARLRSLRPGYWEVSRGGGARGSAGNNPASAVDDRCFNARDPVHHSVTAQGRFFVRYGAAATEAARRKYGGGR